MDETGHRTSFRHRLGAFVHLLIGFADEPTDDDDVRLRKRVGIIAGYINVGRRGGDPVSLLSWIKRTLTGASDASAAEPPPRHERREAGRERHQETGEPAWEESDRLDDPPGTGKRNRDAAPEILGDV